MNLKKQFINEFDGKGKVFSALLSVLTLFAVLGKVAPQWYDKLPKYAQWICGVTTWSAYNKQADMLVVQSSMILLPVLFFVFAAAYILWNKALKDYATEAGAAAVTSYIVILCMFYTQNQHAESYLCMWLFLVVGIICLAKKNELSKLGASVVTALVTSLAVTALFMTGSGLAPRVGTLWQEYSMVVPLLCGVAFLLSVFIKTIREKQGTFLWLQFLLPLAWLGMFRFRYRYEQDGALLELFYSGKWKWFCVLMCVLLLAIAVLEKKRTNHTIYLSTFIMAAVLRVFAQPEGMVNIDYFHNGEITMPMQQLMSYGKLPYVDLIPIHGMCDYFFGLISYLFFDGTYLSLNAAKVVGELAMAVLLASVIYFFVSDKWQGLLVTYLFMPFMVQSAGMRYLFLIILFFVLFSEHTKKGMQSLYAWILLSIAAIAWNASIGGAAALAFLPVIVYRLKRDVFTQFRELIYSRDKRRRNMTIGAWILLFLLGVAFIPLFLQIVIYLKENTGTTLYVNGMEMLSDVSQAVNYFTPGLVNEQGSFFLVTFAFLVPLLLTFILVFQKEKCGAGEFFVTYFLSFWVLANYSFVRYDEGMRARVLGIFFLMFTSVMLLYKLFWKKTGKKRTGGIALYTAALGLALLLADSSPFVTAENLVLERNVPASVETTIMGKTVDDPVVHVSGDMVGMPSLGVGFIQGNTFASLQNVQKIVTAATENGQTVFDITNAVANAVILDMPMYLPYSSAYNISNDVMQEKAIKLLEKELPDIILAAPEIRFDDAPFSFRSMRLYRYLLAQDYVPYKYFNVIYLVRGENPLPEGEQNTEAFAQLMHKKDLAYLPSVWGGNMERINENAAEELIPLNVAVTVEQTENGYRAVFDRAVSGTDVDMLGICIVDAQDAEELSNENASTAAEQRRITMVLESRIAGDDVAETSFYVRGEQYLIPVCCSPYFTEEDHIEYIDFICEPTECQIEQMKVSAYRFADNR